MNNEEKNKDQFSLLEAVLRNYITDAFGWQVSALPADLRLEKKLPSFKKRLKEWVGLHISI